ncbi:MAG TPA: hypothetical protein VHE12_09505, partial [bacterium]|nr:hypothetical protein [bacterium]
GFILKVRDDLRPAPDASMVDPMLLFADPVVGLVAASQKGDEDEVGKCRKRIAVLFPYTGEWERDDAFLRAMGIGSRDR